MKTLLKETLLKKNKYEYAITEANILKKVRHPFILELILSFQTPKHLFFIVNYCEGGDLLYQLLIKKFYKEKEARIIVAELILAIEYLHSMNIFYRDMKTENILLGSLF